MWLLAVSLVLLLASTFIWQAVLFRACLVTLLGTIVLLGSRRQ